MAAIVDRLDVDDHGVEGSQAEEVVDPICHLFDRNVDRTVAVSVLWEEEVDRQEVEKVVSVWQRNLWWSSLVLSEELWT